MLWVTEKYWIWGLICKGMSVPLVIAEYEVWDWKIENISEQMDVVLDTKSHLSPPKEKSATFWLSHCKCKFVTT